MESRVSATCETWMNLSTPASYATLRGAVGSRVHLLEGRVDVRDFLARLVGTGCRFVVLSNHVHDTFDLRPSAR